MNEDKIAAAILAASVITKSSDQVSTEGAVYLYKECLDWMRRMEPEGKND